MQIQKSGYQIVSNISEGAYGKIIEVKKYNSPKKYVMKIVTNFFFKIYYLVTNFRRS